MKTQIKYFIVVFVALLLGVFFVFRPLLDSFINFK